MLVYRVPIQLPTLTLQPSLFSVLSLWLVFSVSSAPEMPETSTPTDGCYQRRPSRLQHCCVLTWPRLWFRRKGNSVEQNTAVLLRCIEWKDLEHQIEPWSPSKSFWLSLFHLHEESTFHWQDVVPVFHCWKPRRGWHEPQWHNMTRRDWMN